MSVSEGAVSRTVFSSAERDEIRQLLGQLPSARRSVRRMSVARLRRMGLSSAGDAPNQLTLAQFDQIVASGAVRIDDGGGARAVIYPHSSGRVFRVAVGVTEDPVEPTWSAFDQRYQWFTTQPRSIASGDHLFVLAVGRWRSSVVGLYETVTAGAAKLRDSPNPERWPWALGVRPLAAIPPPEAERVEDQIGPQSGLPARIVDQDAIAQLYGAVASSPPPPGPTLLEQRVQEVEWRDVLSEVLQAVEQLESQAREPAVIARAIELGGWNSEELEARAWYTGAGDDSHIHQIVRHALQIETGSKGKLERLHGVFSVRAPTTGGGFGVPYRTHDSADADQDELPKNLVDLAELDRATRRHMQLQDRLARELQGRGIEPLSPGSWQPQFDLAFEHGGKHFVVEVKSGYPVSSQQMRLGAGQVLEYRQLLSNGASTEVRAAVMVEGEPPAPWRQLAADLGIQLLRADQLEESLSVGMAAGDLSSSEPVTPGSA